MIFTILVTAPPYTAQGALTALHFANAALKQKHTIETLFFYQDGVHNANNLIHPPEGEFDIRAQWQALYTEHKIPLQVCVAAGIRRGLIDDHEAKALSKRTGNKVYPNLAEHFKIVGLGQFITALSQSDRLVTFGA